MQRLLAKQAEQDPVLGTDLDDATRLVLGLTQHLPRDENGRIRLPESFIAHAGLKDRVIFVGVGQSFRIWEPEAYAPILEEQIKQARALHAARRAARAGRRMSGGHIPVLLGEVLEVIAPRDGAHYIDGTFGGGGYSRALLDAAQCRVLGIDRDPDAIARGARWSRNMPAA